MPEKLLAMWKRHGDFLVFATNILKEIPVTQPWVLTQGVLADNRVIPLQWWDWSWQTHGDVLEGKYYSIAKTNNAILIAFRVERNQKVSGSHRH
jgi:hypothetical protein